MALTDDTINGSGGGDEHNRDNCNDDLTTLNVNIKQRDQHIIINVAYLIFILQYGTLVCLFIKRLLSLWVLELYDQQTRHLATICEDDQIVQSSNVENTIPMKESSDDDHDEKLKKELVSESRSNSRAKVGLANVETLRGAAANPDKVVEKESKTTYDKIFNLKKTMKSSNVAWSGQKYINKMSTDTYETKVNDSCRQELAQELNKNQELMSNYELVMKETTHTNIDLLEDDMNVTEAHVFGDSSTENQTSGHIYPKVISNEEQEHKRIFYGARMARIRKTEGTDQAKENEINSGAINSTQKKMPRIKKMSATVQSAKISCSKKTDKKTEAVESRDKDGNSNKSVRPMYNEDPSLSPTSNFCLLKTNSTNNKETDKSYG